MTLDILIMSKEELINAIAEGNELCEELKDSILKMVEAREELYKRADAMTSDIEYGINTMKSLTETIADMKKLLTENYGGFVI